MPRTLLFAFGAFALVTRVFGAAAAWDPVAPDDLKPSSPTIDAESPAEAIFERIAVDDTDFPGYRRFHQYLRYKIFDPEKAASVTRISERSVTNNGIESQSGLEIKARLSRPNGSVQEFGRADIQERPIVRSAAEQGWVQRLFGTSGLEVREKFLAVSGIEKGSVLDIQISYTIIGPTWFYGLVPQRSDAPIRQLDLTYRACSDSAWGYRQFTLNGQPNHAESHGDRKTYQISLTAHDVPALYQEPFSGPLPDHALTFIMVYKPHSTTVYLQHSSGKSVRIDPKAGPWASYASEISMFETDRARPTAKLRKLVAELTATPGTDEERARRIHRFVEDLHQRFVTSQRAAPAHAGLFDAITSLDQLLDFEHNPEAPMKQVDFVWLGVALYRLAGFEAQTVMLPSRDFSRFDPRLVADTFLPIPSARVRIGDKWMMSFPAGTNRFAFGALPWEQEGQVGLVAAINRQEFVPIPGAEAKVSAINNSGSFQLSAEGTLTGPAERLYTGHSASIVRSQVLHLSSARQKYFFHQRLESDLKPAEITVKSVTGIDDPELPLRVIYEVKWPDYAVATKTRLIFRPAVFQASAQSPFTEQTRHYPFEFPYKWTQTDHLTLAPPPGFKIESKKAPPSIPGDLLSYRCSIGLDSSNGTIHYNRDLVSNIAGAAASANRPIKGWYDEVATLDQFELVFQGSPSRDGAATDAPP